jgi:Na+/H+ antiporter NhaD/arsenite permease-like protein
LEHNTHIPFWSVLPFAGILLSIAIFPVISPGIWHRHYPKIAAVFFFPMVAYVWNLNPHWLSHTAIEYVSFITLLGALFYIAGGIYIKGYLVGHPRVNLLILGIGGILASFIGTTGASMLLIRPLLKANQDRPKNHIPVLFFIFVVSNCGGLLTPLGDPPLYLGFLKGVPFFWTFKLWPQWLFVNLCILAIYFCMDTWLLKKLNFNFQKLDAEQKEPLGLQGAFNFIFLGGVLSFVILYSILPEGLGLLRDVIQVSGMLFCVFLSCVFTTSDIREKNNFTLMPIKEVAILFAAIFACMIPTLKLLEGEGGGWGIQEPWQFFWLTGILSSFLDNAPTYLTFLSLGKTLPEVGVMIQLVGGEGRIQEILLSAISCGAVFMGANSYIGNGPNFMVKSIAEGSGVKMPSFFGYMVYSTLILFPIFGLVTWLFY